MNLSCSYMGFNLSSPLIPGASPMVDDLDTVRRLEDAGAPMIIMHSIFEEQLLNEQLYINEAIEYPEESYSEAATYLPRPIEFRLGSDAYLRQVAAIKGAVRVPVIASLNGRTRGGWIKYAKSLEDAGADGIELNIYEMSLSVERSGEQVERESIAIIKDVLATVRIPVAVKLSSFYSAPVHFAASVAATGAKAVVIFNRFYQADIDIENLSVQRNLKLSNSDELLMRLRWAAAMSTEVNCDLAITGGVHRATDAIKCIMVGAKVVQVVSVLLEHGPDHLAVLNRNMAEWMEAHEYTSLAPMRGCMSLPRSAEPEIFERNNYMRILQGWTRAENGVDQYWK
jgi:dihydroorotate dehydrogenase (fumarate)